MIRFGCCCPSEHILSVAQIGYDYVELSASEIMSYSNEDFGRLRRMLDAASIQCLALNDFSQERPAVVGEDFSAKELEEYAASVCSRAHELGAKFLGIGAPLGRRLPAGYPAEIADRQAVTYLNIVADAAARYPGISIGFEALNSTVCNFCNTQQHSLELVRSANRQNVFVEVDFYHMAMMREPIEMFDRVAAYTGHVHMSGMNASGARRFFTEEDFLMCKQAMDALRKNKYSGLISVEVLPADFSVAAAEDSLKLMRKCGDIKNAG